MFRLALFAISSLCLIVSCGGGGSSSPETSSITINQVSELSESEFRSFGLRLMRDAYSGSEEHSNIDSSNYGHFAQILVASVGVQTSSSNKPTFKPLSNQVTRSEQTLTKSTTNRTLSKIEVDESDTCDNVAGTVTLRGTLSDNGVGSLNVEYSNCVLDGLTVNGQGAQYYTSQNKLLAIFDEVRLSFQGDTELFSGIIEYDQSLEPEIINTTSEVLSNGFTYSIRNFRPSGQPSNNEGQLYHPNFGYGLITTISRLNNPLESPFSPSYESIGYSVTGRNNSSIFMIVGSEYLDAWTLNETSNFDLVSRTDLIELLIAAEPSLDFFSFSDLNFPPVYDSFTLSSESAVSSDSIITILEQPRDPEGQNLVIQYEWRINDVLINEYNTVGTLPPFVAAGGDLVSVSATISDGENIVRTEELELGVTGPIPLVSVTQLDTVTAGSSISIPIRTSDPTTGEDIQTAYTYELISGPDGMLINGSDIEWVAPPSPFLAHTRYPYEIETSSGQRTSGQIDVVFPEGANWTARSGVSISSNFSPILGQFDTDPNLEVLSADGSRVSTYELIDGELVQEWLHPFSFDGEIIKLFSTNIDGNDIDDIILVTEYSINTILNLEPLSNTIYSTQPERIFNYDADLKQIDSDPSAELVLCQTDGIRVIDLESGEIQLYIPEGCAESRKVRLGNVDFDPGFEIVSSGKIFNALTGQQKQTFGESSFNNPILELFDVNSDGASEIYSGLIGELYDGDTGDLLWSLDNQSGYCAATLAEVFANGSPSLVVAQCQFGGIDVYDVDRSGFSLNQTYDDEENGSQSHGAYSEGIVVADILESPGNEILFVTGSSSAGQDRLHVVSEENGVPTYLYPNSEFQPLDFRSLGYERTNEVNSDEVFISESRIFNTGELLLKLSSDGIVTAVQNEYLSGMHVASSLYSGDENRNGKILTVSSSDYSDNATMTFSISNYLDLNIELASPFSIADRADPILKATDLNRDENPDFIYAANQLIRLVDGLSGELIWQTDNPLTSVISDIDTFSMSNSNLSFVAATNSALTLFNYDELSLSYIVSAEVETSCKRIIATTSQKIYCLTRDLSEVIIFDHALNEISRIYSQKRLDDINIASYESKDYLLFASRQYSSEDNTSVVGEINLETGQVSWISQNVIGSIFARNLWFKVNENGIRAISAGTSRSMLSAK